MSNKLFFKHELASRLVVAFSQRKGLNPDEIVDMAFCTAELTLERIQEGLELELAERYENENEPVEYEALRKIIRRFIKENEL